MSPFYFALINAIVITLLLLALKSKEHQESNTTYGFRVFIVVLITSFVLYSYISGDGGTVNQEIDIGEPPF